MNQVRILEVAIPILSPKAVQTPNTCHSMKNFILFMGLIYKKTATVKTPPAVFVAPESNF